jgi:hypothetical protein
MAALLFFKPLLELLENLLESAQRLDELLLFVRQVLFGELAQPLLGDFGQQASPGLVRGP